jgi:hypothetical protein
MSATDYQREIVELHQFFEAWFTGKLSQTETDYTRFAQVMATGFTMVSPDGVLLDRDPLLKSLYDAHNKRRDTRIWIKNVQLRQQHGDIFIVTYEEWQSEKDVQTARLSTVVFRQKSDAPNGLEWLLVHETWLPE